MPAKMAARSNVRSRGLTSKKKTTDRPKASANTEYRPMMTSDSSGWVVISQQRPAASDQSPALAKRSEKSGGALAKLPGALEGKRNSWRLAAGRC
jgi:hypothetical protein